MTYLHIYRLSAYIPYHKTSLYIHQSLDLVFLFLHIFSSHTDNFHEYFGIHIVEHKNEYLTCIRRYLKKKKKHPRLFWRYQR